MYVLSLIAAVNSDDEVQGGPIQTIMEDSSFRSGGQLLSSCTKCPYLRDDLPTIFSGHEKSFVEASLHLVNLAYGSPILCERGNRSAQCLDVELDVSFAPLLFIIH